jgi:hypothetical protein
MRAREGHDVTYGFTTTALEQCIETDCWRTHINAGDQARDNSSWTRIKKGGLLRNVQSQDLSGELLTDRSG